MGLSSPVKGPAGAGGGGIAAAATAGLGLAAGGSAAHSPAAMAALRRGAARFWTAYSLQLAERPLLTKCATGELREQTLVTPRPANGYVLLLFSCRCVRWT